MKDPIKFRLIFLLLAGMFLANTGFYSVNAQDTKKNKVRLKMNYVKVMNEEIYFDIEASSNKEKKY